MKLWVPFIASHLCLPGWKSIDGVRYQCWASSCRSKPHRQGRAGLPFAVCGIQRGIQLLRDVFWGKHWTFSQGRKSQSLLSPESSSRCSEVSRYQCKVNGWQNHKIRKGFGLGETLKTIQFYSCYGQGHFLLDQVVPSPVHPGQENFQAWDSQNISRKMFQCLNTEIPWFRDSTTLWFCDSMIL